MLPLFVLAKETKECNCIFICFIKYNSCYDILHRYLQNRAVLEYNTNLNKLGLKPWNKLGGVILNTLCFIYNYFQAHFKFT